MRVKRRRQLDRRSSEYKSGECGNPPQDVAFALNSDIHLSLKIASFDWVALIEGGPITSLKSLMRVKRRGQVDRGGLMSWYKRGEGGNPPQDGDLSPTCCSPLS